MNRRTIGESLRAQFSEDQASLLAQLLVGIIEYPKDLVRSGEFTELKELVGAQSGSGGRDDCNPGHAPGRRGKRGDRGAEFPMVETAVSFEKLWEIQ